MKTRGASPGKVTEALGGGRFRVEMADGNIIIAYLAGKMKMNRVQVYLGDKVDVVIDPAGGTATNRIVWRT